MSTRLSIAMALVVLYLVLAVPPLADAFATRDSFLDGAATPWYWGGFGVLFFIVIFVLPPRRRRT